MGGYAVQGVADSPALGAAQCNEHMACRNKQPPETPNAGFADHSGRCPLVVINGDSGGVWGSFRTLWGGMLYGIAAGETYNRSDKCARARVSIMCGFTSGRV